MAKGFGKQQQRNPIADAAELLHRGARHVNKPLIIPMYPAVNDVGLKPGQVKPGVTEIRPTCDGVVIAVQCNAQETQELVDWIMSWQRKRIEDDRP